jgi:excisionase family DNA binding protein
MSEMQSLPLLLTIPQCAAQIGKKRWTVYQMIKSGQLPAVVVSKTLRVPRAAIDKLVADAMNRDGGDTDSVNDFANAPCAYSRREMRAPAGTAIRRGGCLPRQDNKPGSAEIRGQSDPLKDESHRLATDGSPRNPEMHTTNA